MKETILLFQIPDKKIRKKVEIALFSLRIRLRYIPQEEYHHSLGFLAKLKDSEAASGSYEGEALPDTMIVFCGLDQLRLEQALAALRKSRTGPFPYKAILTPTNQAWTPFECFLEIKKEHEAMSGQAKEEKH